MNTYPLQRIFVTGMLRLVGGLLEAASRSDAALRQEIAGFPDGLCIGMSVLGERARLRLRVHQGRFVYLPDGDTPAELEIVFKHITHAFLVLSFQESTAQSYARSRMVSHGDVALTMRFVRCLNRMEAVTLPRVIAARALKSYPELSLREKLPVSLRTYGRLVTSVLGESR
jgi:hypothetical protein